MKTARKATTPFEPELDPDGGPQVCSRNGCTLTLFKPGAETYAKTRHPHKHGLYHEIKTPEATLQFNLNGEIVRAQGFADRWPSSLEWLKRTAGNDWVYYSTGGYAGTYETLGAGLLSDPIRFRIPAPYNEIYKATGEYYLPNLPYESNAILGGDPFGHPEVAGLVESWHAVLARAADAMRGPAAPFAAFLRTALENTPEVLQGRAEALFAITAGRPAVLPPDTRHVDYNVMPLRVAEGCRYKCRFCRVKSDRPFRVFSRTAVDRQIEQLKDFYGADRVNYNAVYLAGSDALGAGKDRLLYALDRALAALGPGDSCMQGCCVFLFGSVDSLLAAEAGFFDALSQRACRVFVNIGLESADPATLEAIGKPITAAQVKAAFSKMQAINDSCGNIEITANFLMDDSLPAAHYAAFAELAGRAAGTKRKGTLYFSPLCISAPSQRTLFYFNQLQTLSRLPVFLYLIQRL